jgi:hypothetical protein
MGEGGIDGWVENGQFLIVVKKNPIALAFFFFS